MCSDPCKHISALLNKMSSVSLIDNSSGLLFNNEMQTIEEIRLARLVMLKNKFGGASALAEILEMSTSQLSQWLNSSADSKTGKPRTMNSESARKAEEKLDLPRGWFDQPIYGQDEALTGLIDALCKMSPDQVFKIKGIVGILREDQEQPPSSTDQKINGR